MRTAARLAPLAALFASLAACGPGASTPDAGDGGLMCPAHTRIDFINVNCTSAMGNEGAADCNQRLSNTASGATFFIGGRADCDPDPYAPCCQPLCALTDINPDMCTFDMSTGPGCPYSQSEGYAVVVQTADGHRAVAAVGNSGNCAMPGAGLHTWATVNLDDLTGAARCAASMPAGGFGPVRYGTCSTPMAACGPSGVAMPDSCAPIMLMDFGGPYTANVCTHMCGGDADCGPRGTCQGGTCFAKCGGDCALACDVGFNCSMGVCLPGRGM